MINRNQLESRKISDVRNLIVKDPSIIDQNSEIFEVLHKINEDLRTRHVYIVNKDYKLVGSVRMNSIIKYLFPFSTALSIGAQIQSDLGNSLFSQKVSDIMREEPFYVKESDTLGECAKIFISEKINELPVVKEDMTLIGQINACEIIEDYITSFKRDSC